MSYAYVAARGAEAWLERGLDDRPGTVGSLVPPAERVLWIRHPAYRADGDTLNPITWAEAVPGAGTGPAVQFAELVHDLDYDNGPPDGARWSVGPLRGSVPVEVVRRLLAAVGPLSDAHWCFGVWAGFSCVAPPRPELQSRFSVGSRHYHLLEGDQDDVLSSLSELNWQTPNLWWDSTRSWLIHCDVDRSDTFFACGAGLAERAEHQLGGLEHANVARTDRLYDD